MYGTEALGGIINIITKKPKTPSWLLDIGGGLYSHSGGQNGRDRYSFAYDSGEQDKFSVRVSGSKVKNDALFTGKGLTFEPYGTIDNINTAVDYRLSGSETLSFSKDYTREFRIQYYFSPANPVPRRPSRSAHTAPRLFGQIIAAGIIIGPGAATAAQLVKPARPATTLERLMP